MAMSIRQAELAVSRIPFDDFGSRDYWQELEEKGTYQQVPRNSS
jgi:hypothetical protein